jgi:hypothetical protein
MFFNQLAQLIYLSSVKTAAILNSDRVKPKFCYLVTVFDMNMRWFISITRVKEKTVRANW